MTAPHPIPIEEQPEPALALDSEAFMKRLRAAELACRCPDGSIDHDWMVMHIWLAHCDVLRRSYQVVNDDDDDDLPWNEVFDGHLKPHWPILRQALIQVLPLFEEFASLQAIHSWNKAGAAASVAADSEFIVRAQWAGLPVCEEDLLYALGPDGPQGKEVFDELFGQIVSGYCH